MHEMTDHERMQVIASGLNAMVDLGRAIWGPDTLVMEEIVVRTMVTVGDLARAARDETAITANMIEAAHQDRKKELGNLILSTARFANDLGYDVFECVKLAAEAQERFARKRPRGKR